MVVCIIPAASRSEKQKKRKKRGRRQFFVVALIASFLFIGTKECTLLLQDHTMEVSDMASVLIYWDFNQLTLKTSVVPKQTLNPRSPRLGYNRADRVCDLTTAVLTCTVVFT